MIRMTCDSRLLASAGLGALLLGATPASAQETSDPAAAAAAAGKPVIGAYGFDTQGMDRTVLAGDDFYAYANGEWAKVTAIQAEQTHYRLFTELAALWQPRTRHSLVAANNEPNSKIVAPSYAFMDTAT